MMDKKSLRTEKLKCRSMLPYELRRAYSGQIIGKLVLQREVVHAEAVLCYANYKSEVETMAFINDCLKSGKRVYCPRVLDESRMGFYEIRTLSDLQPGAYGIPEPIGKSSFGSGSACMILPGAVFDSEGNRIGYGKGYYDCYLAKHPEIKTIGICFSCQMAERIPAEPTDIRVDKIITENEVYTID